MITSCALLLAGGQVVLGGTRRHTDLRMLAFQKKLSTVDAIEGFLTHTGIFLNCVDARRHAEGCGQLTFPLFPDFTAGPLNPNELWTDH